VIPTVITQLLSGVTSLNLGSLTPTRDFNFVSDTVDGFISLAECDAAIGEEVNIATGVEHTIADVANYLISKLNPNAAIVNDDQRMRPDASEVFRLIGDNKKITTLTDWRPAHDLQSGLSKTIDWFKVAANLGKYKSMIYNM
jgi:nucleoside-diphosphate-sugar epimerase